MVECAGADDVDPLGDEPAIIAVLYIAATPASTESRNATKGDVYFDEDRPRAPLCAPLVATADQTAVAGDVDHPALASIEVTELTWVPTAIHLPGMYPRQTSYPGAVSSQLGHEVARVIAHPSFSGFTYPATPAQRVATLVGTEGRSGDRASGRRLSFTDGCERRTIPDFSKSGRYAPSLRDPIPHGALLSPGIAVRMPEPKSRHWRRGEIPRCPRRAPTRCQRANLDHH